MEPIRAYALSEANHEIKIQLPPRSTRLVRVQENLRPGCVVLDRSLVSKAILLVDFFPVALNELALYNGGFDTQWLTHGQVIAHVIPEKPAIGLGRTEK